MVMRKYGAGAALTGGAAVAAAMLGMGTAHADAGSDEINGWTVTPNGGTGGLLPGATLSDLSNSLGLGTTPIAGGWGSVPATPLSSIGSNDSFFTPLSTIGSSDNLQIQDNWLPGIEEVGVQAGKDNALLAFLVPAAGGNQVVDLFNFGTLDAPPLFNPDATGRIDVGGVELASPQDGALLNDLADALFKGGAADWGKATTLFDDLVGIDPSSAADAVDLGAVAATLGVGAAHAEALSSTGSPDDLLTTAISNITDADKLLSAATGVDATQPLSFNSDALQLLDQLQSAEDTISAHSGSLSSLVDQLFFIPLDQGWVDASDAVLHGAQELTSTTASGLDIGLEVPSLQLIGDYLGSVPVILTADLF